MRQLEAARSLIAFPFISFGLFFLRSVFFIFINREDFVPFILVSTCICTYSTGHMTDVLPMEAPLSILAVLFFTVGHDTPPYFASLKPKPQPSMWSTSAV